MRRASACLKLCIPLTDATHPGSIKARTRFDPLELRQKLRGSSPGVLACGRALTCF